LPEGVNRNLPKKSTRKKKGGFRRIMRQNNKGKRYGPELTRGTGDKIRT